MKKVLTFAAAAAALLAASCTKTGVTAGTGQEEGQKLIIGLSSGSDALTVKSGRPLLSEEAGQDIQEIKLYFVDSESNIDVVKTVSEAEWALSTEYGSADAAGGRKLEVTLKASNGESLEDGTYTVYAVGYSDNSYTFPMPAKGEKWDAAKFYATPVTGVEEVFAGQSTIYAKTSAEANGATHKYLTASENGSSTDTPVVVLNRQVAGITGYFTNIPVSANGSTPAKLRLVASRAYTQLNFINLYGSETVPSTSVNYVVNGSVQKTAENIPYYASSDKGYVVYEMNLSDWFQFGTDKTYTSFADCDINGDGYVGYLDAICHVYKKTGDDAKAITSFDDISDAGKNWNEDIYDNTSHNKLSDFWTNPLSTEENPQQLVAGSVFAGKFVIPFNLVQNVKTLELQVVAEDGTVLGYWNVRVNSSELNNSTVELPTGVTSEGTETQETYNIYRNHMYSLGSKGLNLDPDDSGDDDPDDPDDEYPDPKPEPDPDTDPDPDQPQSLKTTNLLIHVNDRWEIIHDMVID